MSHFRALDGHWSFAMRPYYQNNVTQFIVDEDKEEVLMYEDPWCKYLTSIHGVPYKRCQMCMWYCNHGAFVCRGIYVWFKKYWCICLCGMCSLVKKWLGIYLCEVCELVTKAMAHVCVSYASQSKKKLCFYFIEVCELPIKQQRVFVCGLWVCLSSNVAFALFVRIMSISLKKEWYI